MRIESLQSIMLGIAQARSVDEVLRQIVEGIADCQFIVLARIWLVQPGDICVRCPSQQNCQDQTRCLHLAASAGNARNPAADHRRIDGAFRRLPLGVRKIGRVASAGKAFLAFPVTGGEPWIADPEWMRREGVRTVAAQPLVYRGEVLGVLGIFDRVALGQEDFEWLRVFADHAAVSIGNARAFEEIEYLKARLEEENVYLRREVTEVIGASGLVGSTPGLKQVLRQIQLVAPTDAAVLVTGESGTGKELVARAIHEHSPRKGGALIKVNCGAVPEALFESEFFGHVKGAFTGAIKDKPGRFELADGGTLFLDEIGEVPLPLQPKLLRAVQEQEFERVGDTRTRRVNARIIAATNRDLGEEVNAGRFRQDLFYRLSVFPIEIPPLRQRREDIPPLAAHFVKRAAGRMNRPTPLLSPAAASQLSAHDWPGNVRELQNAVERAVILSQGGPLRFDQLGNGTANNPSPPFATPAPARPLTRIELKRHERANIIEALKQAQGKVFGANGAAALLGMKPTTLASRIKALGIDRRVVTDP